MPVESESGAGSQPFAKEALNRYLSDKLGRYELKLVVGIAVLYFVLWLFLPGSAYWGLDNGIKFVGASRFAEAGSISIPYTGADFDPGGYYRPFGPPFAVMRHNEMTPVFSVPFMVISGILLWLFGELGARLLPLLGGWAALGALWYMWRRHRSRHDGRIFLIAAGLGSPLLFYSLTFWEHSWAAALTVFSVALLSRGRRGLERSRHLEVVLSGLLLGFAVAFRTETFLWFLFILAFWKYTNRSFSSIVRFAVGFLISMALYSLLLYWQTGEWLPLHLDSNLKFRRMSNLGDLIVTRSQNIYSMTFEGFRSELWSIAAIVPLLIVALWRGWREERGLWGWVVVFLVGVWGIWMGNLIANVKDVGYVRNANGVLWISPFIGLAVLYFRGERRRFWRLLWLGSIFFIIGISLTFPGVEGIHWSPRFIITAAIFLLLIASTRAQRWWSSYSAARPVIVTLLLLSVANQAFSYYLLFKVSGENAAVNRWLASTGSEPNITSEWWRPGDTGMLAGRNPWYIARDYEGLLHIVRGLREQGVRRANFIETPPYIEDAVWWRVGVEPMGMDYFPPDQTLNVGNYQLRRRWLRIIPSQSAPSD